MSQSYNHLEWAESVFEGFQIYNIDCPTFDTCMDFTSMHELISDLDKEAQIYFILLIGEALK